MRLSEEYSRRKFIKQGSLTVAYLVPLSPFLKLLKSTTMNDIERFDAIIVGGSYSGLAAALAMGRALMQVLVIDSGKPCNAQTPHSHNFLTQDGNTPAGIASLAKEQIKQYTNVKFMSGFAMSGRKTEHGFEIGLETCEILKGSIVIFATGIHDIMPDIDGFSECWGISAIHCPYCHGYEVRNTTTGILANGEQGYEFTKLISNWTKDLTLFTNGIASLTHNQLDLLNKNKISVVEKEIKALEHTNGQISEVVFTDGTHRSMNALYAPRPFEQHCNIPESLGCEITSEGYIKTDGFQQTSVPGIYACGDNTTRTRTVANAVAMGTAAGMAASKKLILEQLK